MDNDNFTEVININLITESVLECLDRYGFSTDLPINCEALKSDLNMIIRQSIETQGIRTYSIES